MAAILNSTMVDSDTAILDSDTLLSSLRFTQKHSHSTLTLNQTNSIWLTWRWQPSWILPSRIQPFCTKSFTHSFWFKLMMAAILISAMLDSDTLLSSLRFTQKHSHSTLTLNQTNSIWLKLIHASFNLMMSGILNSAILNLAILDSAILVFPLKLTHTCQDWFPPFAQKKLHSFILTQLDDDGHLEFCHVGLRHCHLGFRHLVIFSQIYSKHSNSTLMLTQTNSIWLKLNHSHLNWYWQPSWILPSWIWPSWIQPS